MPADSVEDEINLWGRIRERLGENAELLGSDETFFGDPSERQIISGAYDDYSPYGLVAGTDKVDPVSMAPQSDGHRTYNRSHYGSTTRPELSFP